MLFIDEIHRMSPAIEEILYPAMEDYELDIIIGQGPSARSVKVPVQRFTLIGATTRTGLLTSPLRARFGIVHRLDFYGEDDIREIVQRSARILGVPIDRDAAVEIAQALAGHAARREPAAAPRPRLRAGPRRAATSRSTSRIARCALLEVDEHGFDEIDRRLLRTIIEKFGGGPVGVAQPGGGDERGARRDRGHLRAVPHPDRVSRSHAARARGDGAGVRVFRADRPCERIGCGE